MNRVSALTQLMKEGTLNQLVNTTIGVIRMMQELLRDAELLFTQVLYGISKFGDLVSHLNMLARVVLPMSKGLLSFHFP